MPGTIVPVRTYVVVVLALFVLAGATYGIAYIDLGIFNTVVALVIAFSKMTLVGLFFMHVRYKPGLTRIAILAAFFWLALLVSFTAADVFTRGWIPIASGWNP
jgi:cytochrome c oxidase subunit IV